MTDKTPQIQYYTALLAARQGMGKLVKNASNPHFRSKYADLSAVVDVISDALADNGILFEQFPGTPADGLLPLDTVITHAPSGHQEVHSFAVPVDSRATVQNLGSALTYARRYALMSIFGLAPEDDDGNRASNRNGSQPQRQPQRPPQQRPQHKPAPVTIPGAALLDENGEPYEPLDYTSDDNPFRDGPAPSPTFSSGPEAHRWAVAEGYCQNEYEARKSWMKIVNERFGGKVQPANVQDVIAAFVARQLEKAAA